MDAPPHRQKQHEMEQDKFENLEDIFKAALKAGRQLTDSYEFYSVGCAGLVLGITSGQLSPDPHNGSMVRTGQKIAEFSPVHGGIKQPDGSIRHYGRYTTRDPETALVLLRRTREKDDLVTGEDYFQAIKPAEIQISEANQRTIDARNELAAYLAKGVERDAELARLKAKEEKEPVGAGAKK